MRRFVLVSGVVLCSLTASPVLVGQSGPPPLTPFRGLIDHVSRTTGGGVPTGMSESWVHALSGDGRYVAFSSNASDIVADDYNWSTDIFLRDRVTGTTTRMSVPDGGGESDGNSWMAAISTNGRHVAFSSAAMNLVAGDTNGQSDVFVRDLDANRTVRVSVGTGGTQGDAYSEYPAISADGRFVAFVSSATTFGPATVPNGPTQVYVHDRDADADGIFDEPGATALSHASVAVDGGPANQGSMQLRISADGRYVLFESYASNLDPSGYSGNQNHVYVRDRVTAQTTLIDRAVTGGPSMAGVTWGSADMSDDGRFVTFTSTATDIVPAATNGQAQVFRYDASLDPALAMTIVSVRPDGVFADRQSYYTAVSADGRYVGFMTGATNLAAPAALNGGYLIVVADTADGSFTRVDVTDYGMGFDGYYPGHPSLSADGTAIAFQSDAQNAVNGVYPSNGTHVFVVTSLSTSTPEVSPQAGGIGSIDVNTSPVSGWEASVLSFDDWIVLTGGAEYAAGPRTLYYLVSPNPGGILRTGQIRVGSTFVTVRQQGDGDTTPPVITPIVTGTQGGDGWYTSNVTVSWAVSDPESEVVNQSYACTNTLTLTTDAISWPVTCEATSHGGPTSQTVVIRRDTTGPSISISQPAATFYQPTVMMPSFSCDDPNGYSGVATCEGSTPQNGWLPTSPGRHVFTVTATDRAGNSAIKTVEYIVAGSQACVAPPLAPGHLARWWRLDGNLRESITGTDSGLNVGTPTFQAAMAQQGWYVSGSGNFLYGGVASATVAGPGLTAAAWVRPNGQYGSYGTIVSNPLQYHIARYPDGTLRWAFNTTAGFDWVNTGVQLPLQYWSHVAVTYTGGHVRSYVNGRLVHDAALSGTLTTSGNPLSSMTVGGRSGVLATFIGLLDDVMIFDDALPDAELDSLALAGSGSLCRPYTTTLTLTVPQAIEYGSTFQVTARLTASGNPLPSRMVTLTSAVSAGAVHNLLTDANGSITTQFPVYSLIALGDYPNAITAAFANDGTFTAASASASVAIVGGTPAVTWPQPSPIAYATALDTTQLNATTSLPGTFVYSPAAGTVLDAGTRTLSVTFTPSDTAHWAPRTLTRTLVVSKATPAVEISSAPLFYNAQPRQAVVAIRGLAGAELNPVSVLYNGAAVLPVNAGTYALQVSYAGSTNYEPVTATGSLVINKTTPIMGTFGDITETYDGLPHGVSTNVASFDGWLTPVVVTYNGSTATPINAGVYAVEARYEGSANYNAVSHTATLTILKAAPNLTWSNPPGITYGTPLGSTHLNANVNVAGTLTYAPVAGTVLVAGTHTLTATFTPDDATNYQAVTATRSLAVSKANAYATWSAPAPIVYGTPLGAEQLNATANTSGTFAYSPAAGTVLSAGTHIVWVTFTPDDTANYNTAPAVGVPIVVTKAAPAITWPTPGDIVYGTVLGGAQLNAGASVPGTFAYSPAPGAALNAGSHTLSVTFTPTDAANYSGATASVTLNVAKAQPAITWPDPAGIVYGTALGAAQLNASAGVPGTLAYSPEAGTVLGAGTHAIGALFTPDDATNYQTVGVTRVITVSKATAQIAWDGGPPIVYGTPLEAMRLNATANTSGTFMYSPAAGAVLPVGTQTLSVTFTPDDVVNYNGGTASIQLFVTKATPTLTWPVGPEMVYGTPLGPEQLNATANVPGTFVYSPGAGTVLDAGLRPVTVTFTPDDTANYTGTALEGQIRIASAPATITWPEPAAIAYGTALGAAQLNAAASAAGTFTYWPAAGTVLNAGAHTLSVIFVSAENNYGGGTASVTLNVTKAAPAIAWPNPADIVYGTALGAAQLNATSTVEGTFAYAPALGTVLNAGSHTLSVTFTPSDPDNYGSATASVALNVAKAASAITSWEPADLEYGVPLGFSQLNASANAPGTLTYSPAAGTVLGAGPRQLSVTFTPADPANYTGATASRSTTVHPAQLKINVNNASKVFGAPLPALTTTPDGFVNGDSMVSLNGSLIVSTAATASSPPGSYVITASGVSSPNYVILFPTGTLTIAPAATVTSVVASPNPAGLNQPVTLTASVAVVAPGTGTPTGTVTFIGDGTPLGVVTVSGGTASLTTNGFASGNRSVTAMYSGDGNFATSFANGGFTVKTSAASSTTAVTSSTNPSSVGQTITLTATVTAPSGLSGSVAFYDGATLIGTAALSGTTARLFNVSPAAGGHAITARYLGNATIPPSVSPALAHYVRLSGTTRTSTVALVASPASPAAGSTVTLTVTVTGSQNRAPSGVVLFMVNGFVLGEGTVSQTGTVTAAVSLPTALPHGLHRVEAVYLGDTTYRASKALISLVVN